jgi:hypothetical protein
VRQVYSASDTSEAELLKQLLTDNDIPAVVEGAEVANVFGEIPPAKPAVSVPENVDWERVTQIVSEFENAKRQRAAGIPWVCPRCRETIEPQFSDCWNCAKIEEERKALLQKRNRALTVAVVGALFCAFLVMFLSAWAQTSDRAAEFSRTLLRISAIARLALILFVLIGVYFLVRRSMSGRR